MKKTKKTDILIKSAFIIAAGGFLSKIIGALYRIPLTNLIGSKGIGIYQLVFPMYALLLTISSTGIPQSLSKLISEKLSVGDEAAAKGVLKSSLLLFGGVGFFGSLALALFSAKISSVQGEPLAATAYLMISPSVFLVSMVSCFRGYFQGRMNMLPTSASQVLEQLIKLCVGLTLVLIFKGNIALGAALSCLAVTVSEIGAIIYLVFAYKKFSKTVEVKARIDKGINRAILNITLPVTLSAILIPISQIIDSFLIINIIGKYEANATNLYGIFTGGVMTIISLPVAVCYGVAAAIIPLVAKYSAQKDTGAAKEKTMTAVKYTLFLAVPSFIFCQFFSLGICKIIFAKMPMTELLIMARLFKFSAAGILFLALTQTLAACLIARSRPYIPALSMLIGVAVKAALELWLLRNPNISIIGGAISASACYLVAASVNLVYIIKDKSEKKEFSFLLMAFGVFSLLSAGLAFMAVKRMSLILSTILGGTIFLAAYICFVVVFNIFDTNQVDFLFKRRRIEKFK